VLIIAFASQFEGRLYFILQINNQSLILLPSCTLTVVCF